MNFLTAWISMKFKIDFDDILILKSGADYSAPLFCIVFVLYFAGILSHTLPQAFK